MPAYQTASPSFTYQRADDGRLAHLVADDEDELWDRVAEGMVAVKVRPDLLRGFIRLTGLPGVSLVA
ncbi:MAG TPA: hypothetical protein VM597_02385 [Gemmataceae bacterium]|jgi:hypothetical protein|nr:hypothetical protein [Gemmataceae bacterium]